jgi:lysophospholipase L1-like esterase
MVVSCLALAFGLTASAGEPAAPEKKPGGYGAPGKFEKEMQSFDKADAAAKPPEGAIVCTGSSSMRGWRTTIAEDLAPLTVIPRGFGGSSMNDLLHHADRLVLAYKPRAVVVYEGDNDIASGIAPERILEAFKAFVAKVREKLPEARIYVLSIKPSPSRWSLWKKTQEANALLKGFCAEGKLLTYVDVATPMLNEKGEPRKELFLSDNLHMVRAGYEVWRDTLRPVLMAAEEKHEKPRQPPAEKPAEKPAAP